jgi:hypothetical protein
MQTKLKPIFLLVTLAATAILLYTANDARAQNASIGIFDVSAFSPNVISITPKLKPVEHAPQIDSILLQQQPGRQDEIHSDY